MKRWAMGLGAGTLLVACGLVVLLALPARVCAQGEGGRPRREPPRPQKVDEQKAVEQSAQPAEPAPAKAPTGQESPPPPREIASVRFEATVFQVAVTAEHMADLDAKRLSAEASSPAKLAQVLQKLGATKVLYRIDQTVMADGGRQGKIEVSQDAPYVMVVPKAGGAEGGSAIARQHLGASFEVFAVRAGLPSSALLQATVKVELSAMTDTALPTGSDTPAATFWRISQSYGGPTELGKPVVLISADGSQGTVPGTSVAFVTLLQMTAP